MCESPSHRERPLWTRAISLNLDCWGFDLFELGSQADDLGTLLHCYGELALFSLSQSTLRCGLTALQHFLKTVANSYYVNPYHNALHAMQVTHTSSWLTRNVGLWQYQTDIEHASFLIAALCHDMKHFGRNNAFCISSMHALAVFYNDAHVLENMHAASCFSSLQGEGESQSMLAGLEGNEKKELRSQIIEYILGTDMSDHFAFISKFRVRLDHNDLSCDNLGDRRFVSSLCLKAGDLSHAALPQELHLQWSRRVTQEFLDQGDEECRLGLPVSPLCDRSTLTDLGKSQRGFIEFVCLPLYEELNAFHAHQSQAPESTVDTVVQDESATQRECLARMKTNALRWVDDVSAVEQLVSQLTSSP